MPYADKNKQRNYQRQWKANRRKDWFKDKECVECGESNYMLLELDHIYPDQKVSHNIWSWSKERMEKELAKCQVLCTSCHRDKTIENNGWNKHPCGTLISYRNGCKCEKCKAANAKNVRLYRAFHP